MNLVSLNLKTAFAVSILTSSVAFAIPAECPAGAPNPLNNTNWAFHWEPGDDFAGPSAAIGTFSITTGGGRGGGLGLNGTMTVNANKGITRLASTAGGVQYQCDDAGNLRGGTLQFSGGSQGTLWQFTFSNSNFNEMLMVNEIYMDTSDLSHVLKGTAIRIDNQQACPANPTATLDLASAPLGWSFQTSSAGLPFSINDTFNANSGSVASGFLNFRAAANASLSGNLTTAVGGFPGFSAPNSNLYRLADTAGRFQVYGPSTGIGCAGGTLSLMVGPWAIQYEFVFADGAHSQIFLLSTLATSYTSNPQNSSTNIDVFVGSMKKF